MNRTAKYGIKEKAAAKILVFMRRRNEIAEAISELKRRRI